MGKYLQEVEETLMGNYDKEGYDKNQVSGEKGAIVEGSAGLHVLHVLASVQVEDM